MYAVPDHVQYRYEPQLDDGLFLIYDAMSDEFRTGDVLVRDIVRGVDEGNSLDEIATQLVTDHDVTPVDADTTVEAICEQFASIGFFRRRAPAE